jgi:hypothetical protein
MKAFLNKTLLFCIPLASLFVLLEVYLFYHENSFNTKAAYLKSHAGAIECLFFGSSITAGSINPEFMDLPAANMAHAAQDYQLDSALFFHYIPKMTKLKYVIIETDYHSLEHKNDAESMRVPWYYRYHGIQIYDIPLLKRISIFATSPSFFKTYIADKANPNSYKYQNNQFGVVVNGFPGVFQDLNYNEAEIIQTAEKRLKKRVSDSSVKNYNYNKRKILSVIDYCLANNIQVVFLKSPAYITYRNYYNPERLALRDEFIKSQLQKNSSILVLDFEKDERFTAREYVNDNHLNSNGSEKLTQLVNEALLQHQQKNNSTINLQ